MERRTHWSGKEHLYHARDVFSHVLMTMHGDLFLPSADDLFLLCHFFGTYAAMTFVRVTTIFKLPI